MNELPPFGAAGRAGDRPRGDQSLAFSFGDPEPVLRPRAGRSNA